MTMTTAEILEAAASKIERDGWVQANFGSGDGVPSCVVGALINVTHTRANDALLRAQYEPAMRLMNRAVDCGSAMIWNDCYAKSADEVTSLMRAVAATERARESLGDASPEAPMQNTAARTEAPEALTA